MLNREFFHTCSAAKYFAPIWKIFCTGSTGFESAEYLPNCTNNELT